jgi:hypothetical protein
MEGTVDTLAVPSDEHTPLSEKVVLSSMVKGDYSTWRSDLILECSRYKRIIKKITILQAIISPKGEKSIVRLAQLVHKMGWSCNPKWR